MQIFYWFSASPIVVCAFKPRFLFGEKQVYRGGAIVDWTKIMEWDELLIAIGVGLMLFDQFDLGLLLTGVGVFMFLATEGYLSF